METNIKDLIPLIGTDVVVEFLPDFDYKEWIKGKIIGIDLEYAQVKLIDASGYSHWQNVNYRYVGGSRKGEFIKAAVRL